MPTDRRCQARLAAEPLECRTLWAAAFPLTYGGAGFDEAAKVVQTAGGDVVTTGLFSGTTNFARPGQRAAVLTAQGDTDIYVADYAADGRLKWAIRVGGDYTSTELGKYKDRDLEISQSRLSRFEGKIGATPRRAGEYANDIAVDAAGNVYLAGAFRSSIRAGRITLTADQTFTSDFYDALVMKISATGSVTWAEKFGGVFDDDALTIGLDGTGTPVVGGYYSRSVDFDPSKKSHVLRTDGRDAGFVLRLSTDGAYVWAYQFQSEAVGTDERNAVNDIAVTSNGTVYFDGTYADKADFDPSDADYDLDSEGKTDAVVGRLDRRGRLVWAESTGGKDYDGNTAIALDAAGNVYTAGYFSDEGDVNPLPDVTTTYKATPENDDKNATFSDLLVSKFAADGTPVWQDQLGGGYIELVADLTIGRDGSVYTTGSFFNTADFGPGKTQYPLSSTVTNDGSIKDDNTDFGRNESYDWFVSRLSPRGKFVSAAKFGGADDDYAGGLTVLRDATVLVYGRQVNAVGDRDERQEQSVIEQLNPDLSPL